MNINDSCTHSNPQNESPGNSTLQPPLRRPGGQPGNQNAIKHGYYACKSSDTKEEALDEAAEVQGLDDEISLLRSKIKLLDQKDPDNIKLMIQAINTLSNVMVRRRYVVIKDKSAILEAVKQVFRGVVIPAEMIRDLLDK